MQDRQSLTINSNDTSLSKSKHLDYAIPQSTIASLSAGEVVGIVVDNPDQRIAQKMFPAQVQHNFTGIKQEEKANKPLPENAIHDKTIREAFLRIKWEVKSVVEAETERIINTPGLTMMR